MANFLQPTVLFFVCVIAIIIAISLGIVVSVFRKMREKELQFHQDLRIREMEHQEKMKQLEIELAKAQGRIAGDKVA